MISADQTKGNAKPSFVYKYLIYIWSVFYSPLKARMREEWFIYLNIYYWKVRFTKNHIIL